MIKQDKKTDKEKFGLKGPVKQYKKIVYEAVYRHGKMVPGKMRDILPANWCWTFDRDGNKIVDIMFNSKGEYVQFMPSDSANKSIDKTFDKNDECISIREKLMNDEGKTLAFTTYDKTGKLLSNIEYKYDENGNNIETICYSNGKQTSRSEREYNLKGQCIKLMNYNAKNELQGTTNYTYTKDGKEKQSITHNENRDEYNTYTNYYDPEGNQLGDASFGQYRDYTKPFRPEDKYEYDHHDNETTKYSIYNGEIQEFTFSEYTYYDEPSENLVLSHKKFVPDMAPEAEEIEKATHDFVITPEQWQWIIEGKTDRVSFSPERYYAVVFGSMPSHALMHNYRCELGALRNHLIEKHRALDIYYNASGLDHDTEFNFFVLSFPDINYLLVGHNIRSLGSYSYKNANRGNPNRIEANNSLQFGDLTLYFPAESFGKRVTQWEDELKAIIRDFQIPVEKPVPSISMVVSVGTNFSLKSFPVKDKFEIHDLDLHYGNGFEKFHSGLINKLQSQKKGLILLHGEPGTGKTYYIRHLLRYMAKSKKVVIYMPPNMVDHLIQPSFLTFIANTMSNYAAQGKSCVLLIEDAEPLLAMRESTGRVQAITNLLNMTDGLLNDLLNIQIICTFNVELKKLDSALLRPGRLIARKEFGRLPAFEANILANHLGIKYVFDDEVTISEIYAKLAEQDTLLHEE